MTSESAHPYGFHRTPADIHLLISSSKMGLTCIASADCSDTKMFLSPRDTLKASRIRKFLMPHKDGGNKQSITLSVTGGVRRKPIIKIAGTKSVRYMVYADQSHRQEASTQTKRRGQEYYSLPSSKYQDRRYR